jgi:hypothetical protein
MDINTLAELVTAVSDTKTAGYVGDFFIEPRRERYGSFTVVDVFTNEPNSSLNGQWWFDGDFNVMQVL